MPEVCGILLRPGCQAGAPGTEFRSRAHLRSQPLTVPSERKGWWHLPLEGGKPPPPQPSTFCSRESTGRMPLEETPPPIPNHGWLRLWIQTDWVWTWALLHTSCMIVAKGVELSGLICQMNHVVAFILHQLWGYMLCRVQCCLFRGHFICWLLLSSNVTVSTIKKKLNVFILN